MTKMFSKYEGGKKASYLIRVLERLFCEWRLEKLICNSKLTPKDRHVALPRMLQAGGKIHHD